MGCNANWKPITIQPCTTGIECTTTIANRPDEADVDDDNDDADDDSPDNGRSVGEQTTRLPPPDDADGVLDADRSPVNGDNAEPAVRTDDGIDQSAYETSAEGDLGGASNEDGNGNGNGNDNADANKGKNHDQHTNSDGYYDKDDDDNNSDTGDASEDVDGEYEV